MDNEIPKIAGLLTSTIDHPGYISLNIYLPFCNYNCRSCHNHKIAKGIFEEVPLKTLIWELENNRIIDMVIITGGEPTLHGKKLLNLIDTIRKKRDDLLIRVDSNGSLPNIIEKIAPYVDGFAIDIKAPPFNTEKYEFTIRRKFDRDKLIQSVLIASDLPLTIFRTVKYPWLSEQDIEEIKNFVKNYGKNKPYYINPFYEVSSTP